MNIPRNLRYARIILMALLLVRFVFGIAYSVAIPLGEAPDEADHYAYAAFLGRERRLPDGPSMTQAKHPPLYHALAALAAGGSAMDTAFLRSNPDVSLQRDSQVPNFFIHTALEDWPWQGGARSMHAGRLVSVVAGLILTLTTYALGRLIWPGSLAVPLGAAAFVALLPESLFIGASMSNDLLASALAALAMLAGLWRPHRAPGALSVHDLLAAGVAGSLMGLGLLTKFSTVAVWPAVALVMLVQDLPALRDVRWAGLRQALVRPALASLALLVFAAPWFWRNTVLHGDPLGMALVRATVDQRLSPLGWGDLLWLLRGWFFSFWGKFGGAGHLALPAWQYGLWSAVLLGAAAGWLRLLTRRVERTAPALRGAAIVLWAAPALTVLSIVSYSQVALGTDQGRLLFPALAPIALLIARGLAAWLPPELELRALAAWTGLLGTAALAALLAGIVWPFAAPPQPPAADAAQAAPVGALFGDRLRLVSARTGDAAGSIVLYWQAEQPIPADLRTAVRLYDAGGAQLWEWKRSPAAGRYSTDHWPVGRIVADVYAPPAPALAQAARVEVGIYAFPGGEWLGSPAADMGRPFIVLARYRP